MSIIIEILLISLTCMGLFVVSYDGMVLEPLRLWLDNKIPVKGLLRFLFNPFIGCPICYASLWGTILHFTFAGFGRLSFIYWVPVILSVAFLNRIFLSIKENLEK